MKHYYELIDSFKTTMRDFTSITCISVENMEADDVIAAYCQLYATPDREIYIVSSDRDFVQLLRLPNVKLINPDNGKPRNQPGDKEYEPDLDYWIFLKCVRGDMGDYVPAAYPKVRETKIKAAFQNDYDKVNFMNARWTDENNVEHRVGDLFEHNITLLDLFQQPQEIRERLLREVTKQAFEFKKYAHFPFLKFLDQFRLDSVRKEASKFVDLFTNNQRFMAGQKSNQQSLIVAVPPVMTNKIMEF